MVGLRTKILEACDKAINKNPGNEVDPTEAVHQILVIKRLVQESQSYELNKLTLIAQQRFEDLIKEVFDKGEQGSATKSEVYKLGTILGYSKEQINNAIENGYL